ncbi:MAG: class C sortase [Muribaculaceae bacterium]|nr:class C sortase [Roseburia sp.]MCM1431672.1 class C sortase [Muribaculaceae bacterium]MCM1491656.1 class C sortase [Muribaculaceae bacterium]
MKKHLSTIILVIVLVVGLSLLLYPTVSDYWNSFHQSRAIASYQNTVDSIDETSRQTILQEADAYNKRLLTKADRWTMTDEDYAEYEGILNVSGTGIMGYVEIPSIQVQLPIYHGTDATVLQIAVGHIEGSSLPVGGIGTHAVISGHRGLSSARLFTDIDQLTEGDIFRISVLGGTLTYQVDQIHIVLPNELNDLEIDRNQDYCTLVTCTPYGVNSHRLLVRGRRIENEENARIIVQDASMVPYTHEAVILTVVILVLYIIARKLLGLIDWEYILEHAFGREEDESKADRKKSKRKKT